MTTITTAKAREIAHYMNTTVHDIRALAISRGVTIDDTPVDDTETDAEEQEAAMQDDLEERVAMLVLQACMGRGSPHDAARAITPLVLEHAAKLAETLPGWGKRSAIEHGDAIAAAIRAMGAKP